jgi:hypothetical protein
MPRLENWSVIINDQSPFIAPELCYRMLNGEIYNDERGKFKDGTRITTSPLVEFDYKNKVAKTLNTIYTLGNLSENYLKWVRENNIDLDNY